MRIISGIYRGRKLYTLEGLKTRPTLDQTKEAIFSSIGGYLNGQVILDVFGGSGALSLESISRGASKAYIIDNNIEAIDIIKKNKEALRVQDELVIYHGSYEQILRKLTHIKFDVIFLDPPFRMKVIDELIEFIIDNNMLKDDGYIVAEYPKEDVVNKNYENFRVRLCRRYSSSEVLILERE
jgi:16S rRNA (guanine(966)-N(2))-methyltransferase RsmD